MWRKLFSHCEKPKEWSFNSPDNGWRQMERHRFKAREPPGWTNVRMTGSSFHPYVRSEIVKKESLEADMDLRNWMNVLCGQWVSKFALITFKVPHTLWILMLNDKLILDKWLSRRVLLDFKYVHYKNRAEGILNNNHFIIYWRRAPVTFKSIPIWCGNLTGLG